jgi:hypothetical protein
MVYVPEVEQFYEPRSLQGTKDTFFSLGLRVLVAIFPKNAVHPVKPALVLVSLGPAEFFISHEVSKALRIPSSLWVA